MTKQRGMSVTVSMPSSNNFNLYWNIMYFSLLYCLVDSVKNNAFLFYIKLLLDRIKRGTTVADKHTHLLILSYF